MSELVHYRKADLQIFATEFGVDFSFNNGTIDLIRKIERSPGYKKTVAITQLQFISEDRKLEIETGKGTDVS